LALNRGLRLPDRTRPLHPRKRLARRSQTPVRPPPLYRATPRPSSPPPAAPIYPVWPATGCSCSDARSSAINSGCASSRRN